MSSSDGLERLKNWQKAKKVLVFPSVSLKGSIRLFEVRVNVLAVDDSTLMLANIDSPRETETVDIRGAVFSSSEPSDLQLRLTDGENVYLREEN